MRFIVFILVLACPVAASAQTVGSVATAGSACDSSGVTGLADQLVALQLCRMPGEFVAVGPHPNIVPSTSHVHLVMNSMARDAVWTAAGSVELDVNSMFRTLVEQYVLYNRSSCLTPARPGTSPHESGRALDVGNYSAAGVITALGSAGCAHSNPTGDPVHFDCPGPDVAPENIRTFQHLWNLNNPGDPIAEDGAYGPMTESRLMMSPAAGFAIAGDCTMCPPDCDAGVDAGSDGGGPSDGGVTTMDASFGDDASTPPVDSSTADDLSALPDDASSVHDAGRRPPTMHAPCGCHVVDAPDVRGTAWLALVVPALVLVRRRRTART